MTDSPNPASFTPGISLTLSGILRRFTADLFQLHGWQKLILITASVAAVSGFSHKAYHALNDSPTAQTPSAQVPLPGSMNQSAPDAQTLPPATQPSDNHPVSTWLSRSGTSILIGFIVGWAFRTFLKFMATVSTIFVAGLGVLSYFHIINADLSTTATQDYKTANAWVTDQAGKLKDAAMHHVHSTSGSVLGIIVGLKKKRTMM